MKWILELTFEQWTYVLVNVTSIIGLLYAACSSLLASDKNILMKSYNILPDMKIYGLNKENIILNIPGDVVFENLKENTSIFLGFLVSVVGFILDILLETEEISGECLLIIAIPISAVFYFLIYLLSKFVAYLRFLRIANKIKKNKIMPIAYNVFETDNVDDGKGGICVSKCVRECSWERLVINGEVQDKN